MHINILQSNLHGLQQTHTKCTYSTSNNGPSEKRTTSVAHLHCTIELYISNLNSEQRTLISPQRTLANTKLPSKTDTKIMRALVDRFRCATVAGFKDRDYTIVALLASLSCQQQTGLKIPFNNALPRLPSNAYKGYLRIPDPQRWSRIILMILVLLLPQTEYIIVIHLRALKDFHKMHLHVVSCSK